MSPAEIIIAIASRLEAQTPAPGSPEALFCIGIRRWLGGEFGSLDEALGLRGDVGIETAKTQYLRQDWDKTLNAYCRFLAVWAIYPKIHSIQI